MSKNVYFKHDESAIKSEILNSDFVIAECKKVAEEKARETFTRNGFHVLAFQGTKRGQAIAFPNTKEHPS